MPILGISAAANIKSFLSLAVDYLVVAGGGGGGAGGYPERNAAGGSGIVIIRYAV